MDNPGNFDWKVDLDDSVIAASKQYHFRLIEHTNPPIYTTERPRLPSRAFYLYPNSAASVSSAAALSTAIQSAATSPSPSGEAQPPAPGKSSSNVGAIAGGVVGGLAGLTLLCGIALLLLRRVKRKRKAEEDGVRKVVEGAWMEEAKVGNPQVYAEMGTGPPPELDGSKHAHDRPTTELEGSTPRDWH